MPEENRTLVPLSHLLSDVFPADQIAPLGEALADIALDPAAASIEWDADGFAMRQRIVFLAQAAFDLPFITGASIHLGRRGEYPHIDLTVATEPVPRVQVDALEITLHLPPSMLQAYRQDSGTGEWSVIEEDGESRGYDLTWVTGIKATFEGDFEFSVSDIPDIVPAMIGNTGLVLELERLAIVTAELPEGLPAALREAVSPGFSGLLLDAEIHYIKSGADFRPTFALENAAIGSGGFTGTISYGDPDLADRSYTDEQLNSDPLPARLERLEFEGIKAVIQLFSVTLRQSVPVGSGIVGYLYMPFVGKWTRFEASLGGPDADFMLEVGAAGNESLIKLEHEWFEITADSIAYITKDDIHYAQISGKIKPKLGNLNWPSLKADKLLIGSDGSVELEGGWLVLPDSFTLDFHAFKIQLTQLGMGNELRPEGAAEDDDEAKKWQWLGLSGSINLVEGIPISASVEGLKFSWPEDGSEPVQVSLTGIGVSLEIPNTLKLEGAVSYKELKPEENPQGLSGHIFKGSVNLNLIALRTQVAGELIIGRVTDAAGHEFTAFYIVIKIPHLPCAIILGTTGMGIFGFTGLFGMHIGPHRFLVDDGTEESYFKWYKADRGEAYSVTPVDKWIPLYDNYAFGAGLSLGTIYDDGFSLNINALVAVLIPGPVVIIEGKADLLKQRSGDKKQEGALYALVVFDGRAGTFQLNIDVQYSLEGVIKVGGGMEAFFDFNDATAWYIHIGKKEPESKRIQAEILSIVKAKAYFMIDNFGLQTGAFVGVEWRGEYGPVTIAIVARFSFDAAIFWKPLHLEGAIELYGELSFKILGVGLEILLQLLLEARAPTPYWIHGVAKFKVTLFWPLPTLELEAEFTWEEEKPAVPVLPLLKGAALLHHKMPGASWPALAQEGALTEPPADEPVFPVDARPVLSFARRITGLPKNGSDWNNFHSIPPDAVGNFEFSYQIEDVHLEVFDPEARAWQTVRRGINDGDGTFQIDDLSFLNGWDAQEPQIELWRCHALDTSSLSQREQFADRYPPCPVPAPAPTHCVDWMSLGVGTTFPASFRRQAVTFDSIPADPPMVEDVADVHVLTVQRFLFIQLPETAGWLEVRLVAQASSRVNATAFHRGRAVHLTERVDGDQVIMGAQEPVDQVLLYTEGGLDPDGEGDPLQLVSVCYKTEHDLAEEERSTPIESREDDAPAIGAELILGPNRSYRLTVNTLIDGDPTIFEITETDEGVTWSERDPLPIREPHYFYFRTDGGPGTAPPSESPSEDAPAGNAPHVDTPLNSLATYLLGTTPAHGAANHYYDYDIRLDFNEAYVAQMYPAPLEIRVRDRNGRLVTDEGRVTGAPLGEFIQHSLGERFPGGLPILPDGKITVQAAEAAGDCRPEDRTEPGRPVLYRPAPRGLKPQRMYTAEVVSEGWNDPKEPYKTLHTVQFATSRYATVQEHLTSGIDKETDLQVVRPHSPVSDVPLDWRPAVETAYKALTKARKELDTSVAGGDARRIAETLPPTHEARQALHAATAAAFEQIAGETGTGSGDLPPALEFVRMEIASSGVLMLLLESPEPLDWARMELYYLRLPDAASGPQRAQVVWNDDQTRAFVLPHSDDGRWFKKDVYHFRFAYAGAEHPDLPVLTIGNRPVDESVDCSVSLI